MQNRKSQESIDFTGKISVSGLSSSLETVGFEPERFSSIYAASRYLLATDLESVSPHCHPDAEAKSDPAMLLATAAAVSVIACR